MAKKEVKNKKEKNNKNKKSFFKDFKAELKKVSWPTPKQLLNNTIAVVTIVFITAAIVFVLDLAFETLNKYGIEKIKEVIVTENETTENTTVESTEVIDTTLENTQVEDTTNETVTEETTTTDGNTEASSQENNTENNAE